MRDPVQKVRGISAIVVLEVLHGFTAGKIEDKIMNPSRE
jgi:hypothetical protein